MKDALSNVKDYFLTLQRTLCDTLTNIDGKAAFITDEWQRAEGGGGITRVMQHGDLFEKGGVNFSHVCGATLPSTATQQRPELTNLPFDACGVSLVLHPENPYIPTTHLNVRFFMATKPDHTSVWWFGGGFDLTPYYGFEEDCKHWHATAKKACDPFGKEIYPRFKKWADDYFYLKHRNEPRGIGGIFYDDFNEPSFGSCFDFTKSVGDHFLKAYLPIVERRQNMPFGKRERDFQCYRRGRYVEFNLVYDRGTLFGLQSNGRTESILMSLPPIVMWQYQWQPESHSAEEKLMQEFLLPRDWQ